MPRLLFEKTGNAVWISHLDLMRLFQRAFKRAGLALKHTQGFNPRPSVSIALPLSVGVESRCELLDYELDGDNVSHDETVERLNCALVDGVKVLAVFDECRKIRDIALLDCRITLAYDEGVAEDCIPALKELFARSELSVEKKGKNGITEQDIIPMIRNLDICAGDRNTVLIDARICCQNPTLNPTQIVAAIAKYTPEFAPDFAKCTRLEIFDVNEAIFR